MIERSKMMEVQEDRPSPMESTLPVSSRLAAGAAPRILSSRIEEISERAAWTELSQVP